SRLAALGRDDRSRPAAVPAPARGRRPQLTLSGRAHEAIVTNRAGRERRGRLKALGLDPFRDLGGHVAHPVGAIALPGWHGDLLIIEQVVVGLLGGLQVPRLAGPDRVERK